MWHKLGTRGTRGFKITAMDRAGSVSTMEYTMHRHNHTILKWSCHCIHGKAVFLTNGIIMASEDSNTQQEAWSFTLSHGCHDYGHWRMHRWTSDELLNLTNLIFPEPGILEPWVSMLLWLTRRLGLRYFSHHFSLLHLPDTMLNWWKGCVFNCRCWWLQRTQPRERVEGQNLP